MNRILATAILVSVMASPSLAQDVVPDEEDDNAPKNEYSPYVEDDISQSGLVRRHPLAYVLVL